MKLDRRRFLLASGALSAMATVPAWAAPFDRRRLGDAPVIVERGFAKVGYGQLHFRSARPVDAGQIRHSPVICFHQTPNSSQVFVELMAELAQDRQVYAVDTPGLGESDLPLQPPEIRDYAVAMREFLSLKSLRSVNVIGYHTGSSIAVELALLAPESIRCMLLVGLAMFNAEERAGFFEQPWPRPTENDGGHLLIEWQRSHQWRGPGQSDSSVRRTFIEKISAGDTGWWGARAVMKHDLATAIKKLASPYTVVNTNDDLFQVTPRILEIVPGTELVTIADAGFGVFESRATDMSRLARRVFDGATSTE